MQMVQFSVEGELYHIFHSSSFLLTVYLLKKGLAHNGIYPSGLTKIVAIKLPFSIVNNMSFCLTHRNKRLHCGFGTPSSNILGPSLLPKYHTQKSYSPYCKSYSWGKLHRLQKTQQHILSTYLPLASLFFYLVDKLTNLVIT